MVYDAEDKGAGEMYESVDNAMDQRRKARREVKEREEMDKVRAERPKIQQQFADLKRALSSLADEEWERARKEDDLNATTWVVQDTVLVRDGIKTGYESRALDSGTLTKFVGIGDGRDRILSLKLDHLSSSPATPISSLSSHIDPKGYPTTPDTLSSTHKISVEVRETTRARMLFDGLVHSNPNHAPGWIAAARLEEYAGRLAKAREIIREGYMMTMTSMSNDKPTSILLEAFRMSLNTVALSSIKLKSDGSKSRTGIHPR
ncbi:PRP1 splicing factor, N-terminal-domain-containing protein [Coprinopsis sp. MPI-PUGE-AT-0042]|nr:PRP1 splicing factor, N-terminal-domain-containing protein [Coprinopsis sp. MPI-PUGE-AT-0042]